MIDKADTDIRGKSEDNFGYPTNPLDQYTTTKGIAERAVLAANSSGDGGLKTVSLRPGGVRMESISYLLSR